MGVAGIAVVKLSPKAIRPPVVPLTNLIAALSILVSERDKTSGAVVVFDQPTGAVPSLVKD